MVENVFDLTYVVELGKLASSQLSKGGPLHITLEDGNIDDDHLAFCLMRCVSGDHTLSESETHLCIALILELQMMSTEDREAWWEFM